MTGFENAIAAAFDFAPHVKLRLTDGAERSIRAFLEPESAKSPERPQYRPEGRVDARRYLMIAEPSGLDGSEHGAAVQADSGKYMILRLERMPTGHWECVLKRKEGGADAELND